MDVTVENFTSTLRQVDQRIQVSFLMSYHPNESYFPPDNATIPINDPKWRSTGLQLDPGQLSLCAKLEHSPSPGCHPLHSCSGAHNPFKARTTKCDKFSGLLCQELLQGPKRRKRRWKWVQNADLMPMNNLWLCSTAGVDISLMHPCSTDTPNLDANVYWENIQCYICGKYKYQG